MNDKSVYGTLSAISIKDKVERKGKLDYLSWANAWHLLKQTYPDSQRTIYESEHTGLNYFTDGKTCYVKVGITVAGREHIDCLPVMDYRNASISVEKVTSMDVNKSIQRSTAKAIAMHGLGLSLWTGEDVPELVTEAPKKEAEPTLYVLDVDDDKWKNVLKYCVENKAQGLPAIMKAIETKYKLSAKAKKAIASAIKKTEA
tara:strand:+ start:1869 stop:2471 length:603 start_codon:yes stop_codon:yes gene_type:complete